jgi:hypothetical protein
LGWELDEEFLWDGERPVYLASPARKAWAALQVAKRAAMQEVVRIYASQPEKFIETKLVPEGRVKVRGKSLQLLAFKDGDVRMYCAQLDLHSPALLVVTVVILKKKQRLDPEDAKTAGKRLEAFLDEQEA